MLFKPIGDNINVMSLSFLRMNNGDIGALYICKILDGTDRAFLVRSSDEGQTWSKPVNCMESLKQQDYFVVNNDRVIKLKSGRIIFPASRHSTIKKDEEFAYGKINFFVSDDDGYTWRKTDLEIDYPFKESDHGWQEPGIYELPDGRLWCWCRTNLGCQFECFSSDEGETWSNINPNYFFTAPLSPMQVKNVGEFTVAIWNPIPASIVRPESEPWGRTPFVLAVSYDRGITFNKEDIYYLEYDLTHGYCYPSVIEGDDYFLVGYYYSNENGHCLANNKIIKIKYDEIR